MYVQMYVRRKLSIATHMYGGSILYFAARLLFAIKLINSLAGWHGRFDFITTNHRINRNDRSSINPKDWHKSYTSEIRDKSRDSVIT